MRIVTRIAAAGEAGLCRFPALSASIEECLDDAGHLDEQKARHSLDCEQIQFGSKDDRRVIAFAMEYLTRIESVVRRLANKLNELGEVSAEISEPKSNYRLSPQTPGDMRCERNMKKGRFAFVRTDVTSCEDGIHVKLSVQNPKGVVGRAEHVAQDFALTCARTLLYLREKITTAKIVLIEGEGGEGIFKAAEEMDRKCDLQLKRNSCPNQHNGFCSPATPGCPLYINGRCNGPD